MENENFTVCMSVYKKDHPHYFKCAVDSIVNQSIPPAQIVLVVDGPVSEKLDEVIINYDTNLDYLKVIRLQDNMGRAVSRQIGIENADYELIAIMDSDDISLSDRFEKQLKEFRTDQSIDVVGGQITEFIGDVNNIVGKREVPIEYAHIKKYIKLRNPMNFVTVMMKKSAVMKAGGYKGYFGEEDYFLWVRMLMNDCVFKNLTDNLVNVRVGKEMYSRRGGIDFYKRDIRLQRYIYGCGLITFSLYLYSIVLRFFVEVIFSNSMRGWFYRNFLRRKNV